MDKPKLNDINILQELKNSCYTGNDIIASWISQYDTDTDINEFKNYARWSLQHWNMYKGFLDHNFCSWITKKYTNIPIFVDSKKKDISCFHNSIIKLNKKEYSELEKINDNSEIIVTLGSEGVLYKEKIYPTNQVEVYDVCGAGDIFLCSFVFAFLNCKNIERSIKYANKLASLSVSKFGTYVLKEGDFRGLQF